MSTPASADRLQSDTPRSEPAAGGAVRSERPIDRDAPVAVLVSGGVDSSAALFRLKELGYRNLTAFYLKIWLEDELAYLGSCPWEEDLAFAREACRMADVPLRVVPLQTEYFERVVSYALEELRKGRTPSPDLLCNRAIKFGAFREAVGPQWRSVATGHYARIGDRGDGRALLLRAPDPVKDQTYFLSRMTPEQIGGSLFPIGDLTKAEVRQYAHRIALPNRDRKDSQGICFLGKLRYSDFVRHYLGEQPGPIVERETGRMLGEHRGLWFFTIGQRQGLGLSGGPWYVVGKESDGNRLLVSGQTGRDAASPDRFSATEPHWILDPWEDAGPVASPEPTAPGSQHAARPRPPLRLLTKLRHGPNLASCTVTRAADGRLEVVLDEPDPGIAPGQFSVFYDGEVCLGSAVIS